MLVPTEIRDMRPGDLNAVIALNERANEYAWRATTVQRCFEVGYSFKLLWRGDEIVAIAIYQVESNESHLFNISVAPEHHRQGYGAKLLTYVIEDSRAQGAHKLMLEVRASNTGAMAMYEKFKFRQVAHRKDYYPMGEAREDAYIYHLTL